MTTMAEIEEASEEEIEALAQGILPPFIENYTPADAMRALVRALAHVGNNCEEASTPEDAAKFVLAIMTTLVKDFAALSGMDPVEFARSITGIIPNNTQH